LLVPYRKNFNPRSALAFLHDVAAVGVAWLAAFSLRFNFDIPAEFELIMWKTVAGIVLVDALCFRLLACTRGCGATPAFVIFV
jgi:hypothetical protein